MVWLRGTIGRWTAVLICVVSMLISACGSSYYLYREPGQRLQAAADTARYVYVETRVDASSTFAPDKLFRIEKVPKRAPAGTPRPATMLGQGRSEIAYLYLTDTVVANPGDLRWNLEELQYSIGLDQYSVPLAAIDSLALIRYRGMKPGQGRVAVTALAVVASVIALYALIYSNLDLQ